MSVNKERLIRAPMLVSHIFSVILSAGVMSLGDSVASAQNFPAKPIRLVTSAVGGSTDFQARLVARGISGGLGQNVIVENRPSVNATELVAQALADGYTLQFVSIGLM